MASPMGARPPITPSPDAIATNVEREVLKQPRPPCPFPEQCTVTKEEHGLTYPLCTKRSPTGARYRPGEMVVAGPDTRVALVSTDLGGGKYTIRFLTAQSEETLSEDDIAGRLCKPGVRSTAP